MLLDDVLALLMTEPEPDAGSEEELTEELELSLFETLEDDAVDASCVTTE